MDFLHTDQIHAGSPPGDKHQISKDTFCDSISFIRQHSELAFTVAIGVWHMMAMQSSLEHWRRVSPMQCQRAQFKVINRPQYASFLHAFAKLQRSSKAKPAKNSSSSNLQGFLFLALGTYAPAINVRYNMQFHLVECQQTWSNQDLWTHRPRTNRRVPRPYPVFSLP